MNVKIWPVTKLRTQNMILASNLQNLNYCFHISYLEKVGLFLVLLFVSPDTRLSQKEKDALSIRNI